MIKQPLLPLKWYNQVEEQQFRKLMESTSGEGWVKLRSDVIQSIPFQIKRDSRANNITQFDIVNYDTLAVDSPTIVYQLDIKTATIDGAFYDWIVCDGVPWLNDLAEGFYYFIVSDGVETWYSEVFELCNLVTNLLDEGTNDSFDGWSDLTTPAIKQERWWFCKSTAAGVAFAYSNVFDVIYNEPLQLYIRTADTDIGCGYTSFGDAIKYELRDALGNVVSNTVTTELGWNCFELLPEITGPVSLYAWLDDGEQAEQTNLIYLWPKKLRDHTILEWYDDINFCDIIYNDSEDDNCQYKNRLILEKSHVVKPTYSISEDAVENDAKETVPLTQSAQKFYNMEFAGGHHMSDAMSIVRLHEYVNFYLETGEIIDVCDFVMNNSPITSNDYCELINLTFREAACVKDNCEHLVIEGCCCPNVENVLDVEAGGLGALPACGAGTDGDRYLVLTGGLYKIYECENGVGWGEVTDDETVGDCVYDEDADASETYNNYWYWDDIYGGGTFLNLCVLGGVGDSGGGVAHLSGNAAQNSDSSANYYFPCRYYVQAQYDDGGGFEDIGNLVTSEEFNNNGIDVITGAGNFDFRVRYYSHACDLSYDGDINRTIT